MAERKARVERNTLETQISVEINLDDRSSRPEILDIGQKDERQGFGGRFRRTTAFDCHDDSRFLASGQTGRSAMNSAAIVSVAPLMLGTPVSARLSR